jgi:hypothetical protein
MGATRTIACVLIIILGWAASAAGAEATKGVSSDEVAIRALMDKVNRACNLDDADKGAEMLGSALSDKGYVTVMPSPYRPSEAIVGDKELLCDMLAQSLRNGQKWGVQKVLDLIVVGPIAYTIGETKNPNQDPDAPGSRWLNVFAKEDVGWQIVFSTPAESAEKAVAEALRRVEALKGKSAK